MIDERDKKAFIDAEDAGKKELESDLTKFLNKAYGETIAEHTFLTPTQIKSIRGLHIISRETGDDFFEEVAKDCMLLALSERGQNRQGIERVFTGVYSPRVSYRTSELESETEGNGQQPVKKTKKGILRRFF